MRRWLPLLIFGVALFFRVAHTVDLAGNPFFDHPVIDAAEYDEWARAIRDGDLLSSSRGTFWQPPLYPYFMAAVYFLLGGGYAAIRVAQALVGAGSAALIFLVARRLAGERVATLAGLAAAVYWPFIFFDAELLSVGFLLFLDLLTLFLLLEAAEVNRVWRWAVAGAALGLAVITRPTSLILVPLIIIWLLLERRRLGARSAANAAGVILLSVAVLVGLVAWRNQAVGGEPVLVSSNGGLNFYLGNNARYDETVAIRPGARWSALLMSGPVGPAVTAEDRSRYFLGQGLRWLRENPAAALALYGKKLHLFWNHHEIWRNQDPYFFRRYSRFLGPPLLGFAPVAALSVLGMLAGIRRWRRYLLLYLLFLGHMLGVLLFFVCSRYRLPAVPYLLVFGALGFFWFVDAARRRRLLQVAGGAGVCLVVLAFSLSDPPGVAQSSFAREYYELGRVAEDAGDFPRAEEHYRGAIDRDPRDPDFYVHLAMAQIARGETEAGEESLGRALAIMPDCGDAYYLLGAVYHERGELERAEDAFRRALRLSPLGANAESYARLGAILLEQGKTIEAKATAAEALRRDPDYPQARLLNAHIHLREGEREAALAEVRRVLRQHPEHPAARYLLRAITTRQEESP